MKLAPIISGTVIMCMGGSTQGNLSQPLPEALFCRIQNQPIKKIKSTLKKPEGGV
jgi:hypothetical protein